MKYIFCVWLILLSATISFGQHQNSTARLTDSSIMNDKKLMAFKNTIQRDWKFSFHDSNMVITYKDSVWLLYFNAANLSLTDTSERKFNDPYYIKQHGKKILPIMSFYFENKWSKRDKIKAIEFNNNLCQQVLNLKKKYHLEHLQEWHKWSEYGFVGATLEEEIRVADYLKERKTIEAQMIKIPKCASTNYSIFIENQNWIHALPNMIPKLFPRERVEAIEQLVEDFLQTHTDEEE